MGPFLRICIRISDPYTLGIVALGGGVAASEPNVPF